MYHADREKEEIIEEGPQGLEGHESVRIKPPVHVISHRCLKEALIELTGGLISYQRSMLASSLGLKQGISVTVECWCTPEKWY